MHEYPGFTHPPSFQWFLGYLVGIMKSRPAKNPFWRSGGRWIHWHGRQHWRRDLVPGNIPSSGINLVCFLHRISDRVRVYREHGPTFQEDTIMPFLARGNGFARVRGNLPCDGETKYMWAVARKGCLRGRSEIDCDVCYYVATQVRAILREPLSLLLRRGNNQTRGRLFYRHTKS